MGSTPMHNVPSLMCLLTFRLLSLIICEVSLTDKLIALTDELIALTDVQGFLI